MTKALLAVAKADTPSGITVPSSWASAAVWTVKQFGGLIIGTAFLAYAWNDSNETHKRQTERLISILEARSASDSELARALNQLSDVVAQLKKEAEVAHTKLAK